MTHLLDLTPEALTALLESWSQPSYRARQILEWIYRKGKTSPSAMTDLPAALRERLGRETTVLSGRVVRRSDAPDGVVKLLIQLADGQCIESVLIPASKRLTACLSTQIGCAVGCAFCASGLDDLKRNLTAGEIVEQILHLQQLSERRVSHVVFMGMGEPLANYNATVTAVRALIDPRRLGVSARRITISTIGLPRAIRRLANEDVPINLAISLHAPTDSLRRRLIPAARKISIADIMSAARAFFESRKREVTLEYVLLAGENDSPDCAGALADLAWQLRCSVNLIRYNPVSSLAFRRPSVPEAKAFAARLKKRGVNVHIRRSCGLGARAACGQLRRRQAESS